MALAQTLMVFILIVSFGVLAAVFIFWINKGKLAQDAPITSAKQAKKKTAHRPDSLDYGRWDATTLLMT